MNTASKFPWLDPFGASGSNIWLRDSESVLLWVNAHFVTSIGRPREELLGRKVADLFPAERRRTADITGKVIEERRAHEVIRSVNLQDLTRWFEVNHAPVPPERTAGHGWCVLANAIEITDQVQMAALRLLLGLRKRDTRKLDEDDERFVRLLLQGSSIRALSAALQMSVDEVTGRLSALAGTPLG
jgi:PAS domain S-box-containing protein